MTTSAKVILGIVGAATAGVLIGMLVAPEKGSELRQKVKETANDWATQPADLFAEGKSGLENLKNKATKGARDAQATAEDRYNNVRESLT